MSNGGLRKQPASIAMMLIAILCTISPSSSPIHGADGPGTKPPDHLSPEPGAITSVRDRHYFSAVQARLLISDDTPRALDGFPVVRVICLPHGAPEWAVGVYAEARGDATKSFIELSSVAAGDLLLEQIDPTDVKIVRRKVEIDEKLAKDVQRVLLKMLRSVKYPFGKTVDYFEGEKTDELIFSVESHEHGHLSGLAKRISGGRDARLKLGKLFAIADRLHAFVDAPAPQKEAIATSLSDLLSSLDDDIQKHR